MTRKKRRYLVIATSVFIRNMDMLPERVLGGDLLQEFYDCDDDRRIGGEQRRRIAVLLRKLRKSRTFRSLSRQTISWYVDRIRRNPRQFGRPLPRYYPTTVTKKSRGARRHPDCSYCGRGYGRICGVCRGAGIDGPVIRGTEARKGITYTLWRKR